MKFQFNKLKKCHQARKREYYKERIEATLDLHGFQHSEAITRLDEFCHQCLQHTMRTVMVITGNLVADLLYSFLDPRIRYEMKAG